MLPLHQGARRARRIPRAPGGSGADRGEIAVGVGDLLLGGRDVDAVGEHAARLGEVFGAPDAERAGDPAVLQVPDGELAAVAVAAPDLLVPLVRPGRRTRGSPSRRGR